MNTLPRRAALALPFATLLPARPAAQGARPITVGQGFLADSLDPAQGSAGWALQSHGVAEALFTTDRSGAAVPNLARDARRDDDGTWMVSLLPGLRFSDGAPSPPRSAARWPRTRAPAPGSEPRHVSRRWMRQRCAWRRSDRSARSRRCSPSSRW
jgi:ABC-type transport system substrate-binding protein